MTPPSTALHMTPTTSTSAHTDAFNIYLPTHDALIICRLHGAHSIYLPDAHNIYLPTHDAHSICPLPTNLAL
ncbi:hypothetical protein Hamer_G004709 [Homarus americanus]|uniref:Uncharacterized protein n=1 Tax=Homarus americanus TaxID=6706 RepID=A0A8J5MVW2_HOMAM|nr:hypothetical protein Hamer_G004709 [Homarus americanus]